MELVKVVFSALFHFLHIILINLEVLFLFSVVPTSLPLPCLIECLMFINYLLYLDLLTYKIQKIVPFHEVTCVRRAKTAAIFPTAIEIFAGGKKVAWMGLQFLFFILLHFEAVCLKLLYLHRSTFLHLFFPVMKHSSSSMMDGHNIVILL